MRGQTKLLTLDDLQEIVGNMKRLGLPCLPTNRFVKLLFKREAYRRRIISDPEAFTTRYPQEIEWEPLVGLHVNVLEYPNKQHPPSTTLEYVPEDLRGERFATKRGCPTIYKVPQTQKFRTVAAIRHHDDEPRFDLHQFDYKMSVRNLPQDGSVYDFIGEAALPSSYKNNDLFLASLIAEHFPGLGATEEQCHRSTPSETKRTIQRRNMKRFRAHRMAVEFGSLKFMSGSAQDSVLSGALAISTSTVRRRRAELNGGQLSAEWYQGMSESQRADFWWAAAIFGLEAFPDDAAAALCTFY